MLVNGDLLFHPELWVNFEGPDTTATDGTAFNFDPLFEPMRRVHREIGHRRMRVRDPHRPTRRPYTGYPVFNIPPEVADSAARVGYTACTHATNHSWDQGAEGIQRLTSTLDGLGIAHTGSYNTEAESYKPLLIESPTGGGTLGLVAGTVSLNGFTADYDWRVDRLRDFGDPNHDADIQKAVDKANKAREQGADVVAMAMHSVQEYLTDADTWQVAEAHALADTGAFDVIYGAGCHCAQPIEQYNDTWIIYGLGNALTVGRAAGEHRQQPGRHRARAVRRQEGPAGHMARQPASTGCRPPTSGRACTSGARCPTTIRRRLLVGGVRRAGATTDLGCGVIPWARTRPWCANGGSPTSYDPRCSPCSTPRTTPRTMRWWRRNRSSSAMPAMWIRWMRRSRSWRRSANGTPSRAMWRMRRSAAGRTAE